MKCPKCGYLGFEDADRCRNCGYDFSLSSPVPLLELPLRPESPAGKPPGDLALADQPSAFEPQLPKADAGVVDASLEGDRPAGKQPFWPKRAEAELPLFGSAIPEPDDEPLITRPSAPRAPLAVRRSTPETPRLRADQPRAQSLDLTPEPDHSSPFHRQVRAAGSHAHSVETGERESPEAAGIAARLLAVAIDLLILGVVDALVVYFTLRICGLTVQDLELLPKGPLIAFLCVQNGGYLVAFTAGGQTLGKMAAGIRVVSAEPDASLDMGRAFVREVIWLVLAVPAGLGFLSALFTRDHRGLHDRLAGTRVVR